MTKEKNKKVEKNPSGMLGILEKYFGYSSFRGEQERIIAAVLQKKDCLVLMPTGGGKSLCYQLPALMMDGLTVVISPLIALMKDQVDALQLNGVEAAFINSSQTPEEQQQVFASIDSGKLKMLYVAPERLNMSDHSFINYLLKLNVSLFAIDEAHCISHWGHDFRPDYLTLSQFKNKFPSVPVIALTATADKITREDIIEKLGLSSPEIFISSFNRPNIRYLIEKKKHHFDKLVEYLSHHRNDSGIIYCLSRQNTETLAERLTKKGFPALPYHAGMESDARKLHQDLFKKDEVRIIVATIAFGMGIDKSNVRYVVHTTLPKNIENYYQETGRAGRDGLASEAVLFYSAGDLVRLRMFVKVEGNPEQTKIMMHKLRQMADYCESDVCRRKQLLNYFNEPFGDSCGNCDVCLGLNENMKEEVVKAERTTPTFDATAEAQKILNAVFRLKGKFGATYITDWLRGSTSKKIWKEHKYLRGFGKGNEHSVDEWHSYIEELIELGYLLRTDGEYALINLTNTSKKVMFQNLKVRLHHAKSGAEEVAEMRKKVAGRSTDESYDKILFEELRLLRASIAKSMNVPAFVLFADATLAALAEYMPQNIDELSEIPGFGDTKIKRYGEQFLKSIEDYKNKPASEAKPFIEEEPKEENEVADSTSEKSVEKKQKDWKAGTLKLFNEGFTVEEIAGQRKDAIAEVEDHIAGYVFSGDINVLKVIDKLRLVEVIRAVQKLGDSNLSKLRNALGEDYTFLEIRAAINYYKRAVLGKK